MLCICTIRQAQKKKSKVRTFIISIHLLKTWILRCIFPLLLIPRNMVENFSNRYSYFRRRFETWHSDSDWDDSSFTGSDLSSCKCSSVHLPKVTTIAHSEKGPGEQANQVYVSFNISGMDCSSCAARVRESLRGIPSVTDVQVDYINGSTSMKFDQALCSAERIRARIAQLTGFKVKLGELIGTTNKTLTVKIDKSKASTIYDYLSNCPHVNEYQPTEKEHCKIIFNPVKIQSRSLLDELSPLGVSYDPDFDFTEQKGLKSFHLQVANACFSFALAIPVLVLVWAPVDLPSETLGGAIQLGLTTIIQWICAFDIHKSALYSVFKQRSIDVDVLVTLSTTTAWTYSVVAFALMTKGNELKHEASFETSALLVSLILLGRLASAYSRRSTVSATNWSRDLIPKTVTVINPEDRQKLTETYVDLVDVGEMILVGKQQQIPLDGEVTQGISDVDESAITGESSPVVKSPKTIVTAGTFNLSHELSILVTANSENSSTAQLAKLIQDAQGSRAPIQDLTDRLASWIVPIALVCAVITLVTWVAVGIEVQDQSGSASFVQGLTHTIAVLVVTCPCPLALATPMVFVLAVSALSKRGILLKDTSALQTAKHIDTVLFDKTGTLTTGKYTVTSSKIAQEHQGQIQDVVRKLTNLSEHPAAQAVSMYLQESFDKNPDNYQYDGDFVNHSIIQGCGISALYSHNGQTFKVKGGSVSWLNFPPEEIPMRTATSEGVFCVTIEDQPAAAFCIKDSLKLRIREGIRELQNHVTTIGIVSGDSTQVVREIGTELELLPCKLCGSSVVARGCTSSLWGDCKVTDKAQIIKNLQAQGRKVMFCGDGTNDALAFQTADIGVSVTGSTKLALDSSHFSLAPSASSSETYSLCSALLQIMQTSQRAMRRVKFNLAWCAVYNVVAILFASGAFVHVSLPPAFAGLGELVSIIPVVLVSMTMRWV